jgi:two-component sensor histidine kinase
VQWLVGASRQALAQVDGALGPNPLIVSPATRTEISGAVEPLPGDVAVTVFDADGVPRFSTGDADFELSTLERDVFEPLRAGRGSDVSSMFVGPKSKQQHFVIARPLERDGVLVGTATITVPVLLFSNFWGELGLGRESTVSLFRDDGWLIARYPPAAGPMNLSDYVLFTEHLPKASKGAYDAVSPADGVTRVVGYVQVEGEPLVALASIATADKLEGFWQQVYWTIATFVALAALFGFLVAWLWTTIRRDEQNRVMLAAALDRNKLLFQEIHHRVKNNLQAVVSLVSLQALPEDTKRDLAGRIGAMVSVHEQAYRSDEYAEVDLPEYLSSLTESVAAAFGGDVSVERRFAPVRVSRDVALPLGLLVNEVLSNAFKHAFPAGRHGTISVEVRKIAADRAELIIQDDGVGFDPAQKSKGIGKRLIRGFVAQLGDDSAVTSHDGTRFVLRFAAIP